jgi:hypothetical protein
VYTYSADILGIIVTGAAAAVNDELEVTGCGSVDRVCPLVPGSIAWDKCDCGQLAQTITAVSPTNNFPAPAADSPVTPCGPNLLVVSVTLSLVRCIRGLEDDSRETAPDCDTLLEDAMCLERDRFAARTGIRCYLKTLHQQYLITHYTVGTATSVGPDGMCGGIELPYQFGIAYNGCC